MYRASSTCWVARNVISSSLPLAPTSPENFVVMRSSATIANPGRTTRASGHPSPSTALGRWTGLCPRGSTGSPPNAGRASVDRADEPRASLRSCRRPARLTCAHDRGGCLCVDAMGLAYLDIDQAGICERLRELSVGERSGDAARVCPHVRAGCVVHVLIGDHVGDREAPAWP